MARISLTSFPRFLQRQWFSVFKVQQNNLEALKQRLLGVTARVSDSVGLLGGATKSAF